MFEGEQGRDRAEFLSTFCTILAYLYQDKIARRGDATIGILSDERPAGAGVLSMGTNNAPGSGLRKEAASGKGHGRRRSS